MRKPPLWQPLYELIWIRLLLLWVSGAGGTGELRPEVHLYLGQLYFRLADAFQARGWVAEAQRFRDKGREHELAGPPPEPPPLAMVMGIPEAPILTDARSNVVLPRPPKEREWELRT